MAIIYVDDSAGGANNGTSWTDAYTSIDDANVDGAAAGSDIWVASTHAESIAAAVTLGFNQSTAASPITVQSVNTATDAYLIGAKLTVTGAGNDIIVRGIALRVFGLEFVSSDQIFLDNANDRVSLFEDCVFTPTGRLSVGSGETFTTLTSCTITTSSATLGAIQVAVEGSLLMTGCTVTHASVSNLLQLADNVKVTIEDCDLSASTTDITPGTTTNRGSIQVIVRRCKMKASWTALGAGSISLQPAYVLVEGCTDNTGLTVPEIGLTQLDTYAGTVTGVLTPDRTGGADDGENGPYSWCMVTNANALEQYIALESPPLVRWVNPDTSPSGATSKGKLTSTRMAPLGTPAALDTDSVSTWNGSGVGTKQQIDVVLNNQDAATLTVFVASGGTLNDDDFWVEVHEPDQVGGPIKVVCFLAKPSTTVYIDPRMEVA